MRSVFAVVGAAALVVGCATKSKLTLQRVILYQNGVGYFERTGQLGSDRLVMKFSHHEVDDVLKTLTVIDRSGAGVTTVDVATAGDKTRGDVSVGVRMSAAAKGHSVQVSYAVPTPTWKAAYRIVVDDDDKPGLLQAWAAIVNASQEDWNDVSLTLATGAPMSYALDLHTPQYVERPDATGKLVPPQVWAPIEAEKVSAAAAASAKDSDVDKDGIAAQDDLCPSDAEDKDGFEDEDGCPEPDNDKDRIVDRTDKCPNEPETYNGFDDEDGCPDRGRVIVTDTSIEVLDLVYFPVKTDTIKPASYPVLDAVAATLNGNPSILKIEVQGHAASNEADAYGLATRRAAAVRAYLVSKGVAADRLVMQSYGSTQPIDQRKTEAAHAKNRRVAFLILKRDDGDESPVVTKRPPPVAVDTTTLEQSARTNTKPVEIAGTVRYALGAPVTVKKGTSTMVSILNKRIDARDVYLWRPDPDAPGSDKHPFRVVKLVNTSGFTLQPGSVAIFARGTFVGDSLMQQLDTDEIAWLPYALDSATTIVREDSSREQPVRIVSIQRGTIAVENTSIYTTTYKIYAGRQPARTIYLRHRKREGYKAIASGANALPPGTIDQGEAYLVPVPLQGGKVAQLAIDETEPRRRSFQLLDADVTELGAYVGGSKLPPEIGKRLEVAIKLRAEMAAIEDELEAARSRFQDVAARAHEIRENIKSLEKVRTAGDLRQKLVTSLAATMTESETLSKTISVKTEALATVRTRLQDALRDLTLEEQKPAK